MKYIRHHRESIAATTAVIGLYLCFFSLGITCPIRYITGISCAGCGMTRALLNLARGNIRKAFFYHPLVLVPIFLIPVLIFRRKIPGRTYRIIIVVVCAAFLIVYALRMYGSNNTIVTFEPENGVLWKAFKQIVEFFWLYK